VEQFYALLRAHNDDDDDLSVTMRPETDPTNPMLAQRHRFHVSPE
jgi:hypothetical protein